MNKFSIKLFYFIFYFFVSFEALSEDLFGFFLYSDAKENFSKDFIDQDKLKASETKRGFFALDITSEIKKINKSPYFELYYLYIDENDIIHGVLGKQNYKNIEICKSVSESFKSKVMDKFNIQLEEFSDSYATFKMDAMVATTNNNVKVQINCNYYYTDDNTIMVFYISSSILREAVSEFYNSM